MYLEHWRLSRRPFDNTADPAFFFESHGHQEAVTRLTFAIETQKEIAMLTGEYGSGKTVVCQKVIDALPHERFKVAFVANPRLDAVDLVREITFQLGENIASRSMYDVLHAFNTLLERFSATKNCAVFIDETQLILDTLILEDLRLLLNHQFNRKFLFTLVLVGQTELRDRLRSIPQMTQRIGLKFHIPNLRPDEVPLYMGHRLMASGGTLDIFSADAIAEIAKLSKGNPREINSLCDLALLVGMSNGRNQIFPSEIQEAWKERA